MVAACLLNCDIGRIGRLLPLISRKFIMKRTNCLHRSEYNIVSASNYLFAAASLIDSSVKLTLHWLPLTSAHRNAPQGLNDSLSAGVFSLFQRAGLPPVGPHSSSRQITLRLTPLGPASSPSTFSFVLPTEHQDLKDWTFHRFTQNWWFHV